MTATGRWKELIQVEHEQSDRMRRQVPVPQDHWAPYVHQFKAKSSGYDDLLVYYFLAHVNAEQVVIDVGACGGRLALPLALVCSLVVAVEPSPSMCGLSRKASGEFGISNVEVVESESMNSDVEKADVTLCSPFVRKLEDRASAMVTVVMYP